MTSIGALRWAVIIVDLDPVLGHEEGGERRALVVSYEPFHHADRVSICPITAARAHVRYPNEVELPIGEAGQTKPGVILCHQVRTISLLRAAGHHAVVGHLTDLAIRTAVRQALARHFGLDSTSVLDGATGTACFRP
jgi:mRNA-degrading endonuclease toxin of MazEF toxin-antitoxin module